MNEYGKKVAKKTEDYMSNPDSVSEEINDIQNALHGVDVRGALAAGVKESFSKSESAEGISKNTEQRQDAVEQQFDDVLAGYSEDRPISNEETIAARTNRETGANHQTLGQRLDAENKKVTAQLADEVEQRKNAINNLNYNKANKTEVNELANEKADKAALALVANSKRDKVIEIEMKDLSQDIKEAMTGGSVAVVGENAVGNINLKARSVSRDKFDQDFMANTPWLGSDEFDLDYVWDEGNYYVDATVKNNPFDGISVMNVKRFRTQPHANFIMVKQTIVRANSLQESEMMYRTIRVLENDNEISWKKDWKKVLSGKIKRENIDRLYNIGFPWLNQPTDDLNNVLETGVYMIDGNAKNNPVNDIAMLEVVESKTQPTGSLSWIKQIVTLTRNSIEPVSYYRIFQVNVTNNEIVYMHDWKLENGNGNNYIGV